MAGRTKPRKKRAGRIIKQGGSDKYAPLELLPIGLPAPEGDIVADNIRATGLIYFAAMLEETKLFQVADRIAELFQQGTLPIQGSAAQLMNDHDRARQRRFSETQRRLIYARALGIGGSPDATPNREFNDLWLRFLEAVSTYVRSSSEWKQPKPNRSALLRQGHIAEAAHELATNLSLHGFGMAYFVAVELGKQVDEALGIVSNADVKRAFGADNAWDVVEKVAANELGGAPNTLRFRTLAASGQTIIEWLSARINRTKAGASVQDFIDACEQWLTVTDQASGNSLSQPVESPSPKRRAERKRP